MRHNRRDDGQLSCRKREMKTMNANTALDGHTTVIKMAERGGVPLKFMVNCFFSHFYQVCISKRFFHSRSSHFTFGSDCTVCSSGRACFEAKETSNCATRYWMSSVCRRTYFLCQMGFLRIRPCSRSPSRAWNSFTFFIKKCEKKTKIRLAWGILGLFTARLRTFTIKVYQK